MIKFIKYLHLFIQLIIYFHSYLDRPDIFMVDVVKELEALRQNLLDLSLRNNLLNYRPSQKRTISIAGRNS